MSFRLSAEDVSDPKPASSGLLCCSRVSKAGSRILHFCFHVMVHTIPSSILPSSVGNVGTMHAEFSTQAHPTHKVKRVSCLVPACRLGMDDTHFQNAFDSLDFASSNSEPGTRQALLVLIAFRRMQVTLHPQMGDPSSQRPTVGQSSATKTSTVPLLSCKHDAGRSNGGWHSG